MARTQSTSNKSRIRRQLREQITNGEYSSGDRLPTVRELARDLGTSSYTVHSAIELLKEEGYVDVRHGVGTFVTDTTPQFELANNVVLGVEQREHLFGPLTSRLTMDLLQHHACPMVVDMNQEGGPEMMRSLARAGVRFFIVHGNLHFPFEVLEDKRFRDAWIVSVLDWAGPDRQNLLRVLSDFEAGGRRAAQHLWAKGHRRAVVVATSTSLHGVTEKDHHGLDARSNPPVAFVQEWERLGGSWEALRSFAEPKGSDMHVWLEKDDFLDVFDGSESMPTAVFGFRDVEAARVQQGLQCWCPDVERAVDIVGYYDTPWSRAAHPPLDTFSLRLELIAEQVAELIELILNGEEIDNPTRVVKPELIER